MNRFTLSPLTAGLLLAVLAAGAQAADVSQATDTVKGRAPVANGVIISNQSRPGFLGVVGDVLQVDYSYTDADGDVESGSAFQWQGSGGAINGATASTYVIEASDVKQALVVQVTPATDPATTDPAIGMAVSSTGMMALGPIDPFITPVRASITSWGGANSYCEGLGARLPTVAELQQLFVSATRSPTVYPNSGYIGNTDMCAAHGWPLSGQCGGAYTFYWSSEPSSAGRYNVVNLDSGGVGTLLANGSGATACVR
ncbi:DUF1566 domain-containing protein [Pseudomonas laurylsulfatiphila]|uniref:DUF1566 domain-containing protein n=1 Tax=Pseudomonas laurylsulfatiphila TaxID=2011015 RepID=UPI00215F3838|nr:DUF1566 domain-containing protein [Pseudomonas laurylsulfatiphila]UVM05731.1 DUF1566 domain-containing protein [Pseudomonas laurylsulfatiphila]